MNKGGNSPLLIMSIGINNLIKILPTTIYCNLFKQITNLINKTIRCIIIAEIKNEYKNPGGKKMFDNYDYGLDFSIFNEKVNFSELDDMQFDYNDYDSICSNKFKKLDTTN